MLSNSYVKILLIIAAGLVLAVMLRLGLWQLDRAAEKQAISDAVVTMSQNQIDLSSQMISLQQRYAQASVSGEYLSEQSFFLDGQVINGQVGYHVITPLKITDSDLIILINRGWVAAGNSREIKPQIVTPEGELNLTGRLNSPPSKPVFWDEKIPVVQNGAWQFLDLQDYSKRTGIEVLPLVIELDKTLDQVGGYVRQWRSYNNQWVDRHRAYALQWFSMALAFLVLCLVVWFKPNKRN